LLIFHLSVHIISFEDPLKKRKKGKKKKKGKRSKIKEKGADFCVDSFARWCCDLLVSRLVSLARSRLGPAQYHCWTVIQLAFVTNVVLSFSLALHSAHLQLHIYDYNLIGVVAVVPVHSLPRLQTCWLSTPLVEQGKNW
jgi:hypothetical protein